MPFENGLALQGLPLRLSNNNQLALASGAILLLDLPNELSYGKSQQILIV